MEKSIQIEVPVGYEIDKNLSTFEKIVFKTKCFNYRDIKSYEDACKYLNINPESICNSNDTVDEIAYKKLKIVCKVINNGWVPDWDDSNMKKWYPWFNMSSGFGFSCSYYNCDDADAAVGSRLCLETEEKSAYMGKQFINLYENYLK